MTPIDHSVGRHYHVPAAPALWNCVACDRENVGSLDQGCVHCGAGKQAPPLQQPLAPPLSTSGADLPWVIQRAFEKWLEKRTNEDENPAGVLKLRGILLEAFSAGFQDGAFGTGTPVPSVPTSEEPPMTPAGAEARTLAAALALFIENILRDAPDEIEGGEWLTVNEAEALLKRLQVEGRK